MTPKDKRATPWRSLAVVLGLGVLAGCAGRTGPAREAADAPSTGSALSRGLVQKLTDSSADQLAPSWSADGQTIVYQSNADGNWELYFIQLSDGRPQRLTDTPEAEEDPSLSPDGRWVLCTVHEPSLDADPPRDILLLSRDGHQRRILAAHGADDWYPRFSPDGTAVVFVSDRLDERNSVADEQRQCALFRVDLATGQVEALSEPGAWSAPLPVGERLGLRLGPHSLGWWAQDGVTAEVVDSSRYLGQPDWHGEAGWVAGELGRDSAGRLLVRATGSTGWLELPRDDREEDAYPAWSPDGKAMAFAGRRDGQWDVFLRQVATP